ncbi:hypothetical protein CHARACLAT_030270 [Characodon lateralis]|uniref:Uncharacterized protein n=1 Tax=Characodon lateralis TaxID=208331 RepID=A0ABU7DEZ1_9TELE|nr:hypothetical protein [Characodon lateralis]
MAWARRGGQTKPPCARARPPQNGPRVGALTGLIDSCVEQLKQTHSHLHLESVRPGKASRRKKEVGYLKEVKLTAAILRSALYCSDECKVVAMDARLTLTLSALWPWLLLDDPTMEAVLELLCVYTANFHPGVNERFFCVFFFFCSVPVLSPPSAINNLAESYTLCIKSPIVLRNDHIVIRSIRAVRGRLPVTMGTVSGSIRSVSLQIQTSGT